MKITNRLFLAIAFFVLFHVVAYWGYTDLRPKYIARNVVSATNKYAYDYLQNARRIGPSLLPILVEESNNFSLVNMLNASRIGDLLGAYDTPEARRIAKELYSREDVWSKLAGARALAQHGELRENLTAESFLVKQLYPMTASNTAANLAAETLSYYKIESIEPILLNLDIGDDPPYHICKKITEATNPSAINLLRKCLRQCYSNCSSIAFRLLNLNDKESVSILIDQIANENHQSFAANDYVELLKEITGKDLPVEKEPWLQWWEANKESWTIPSQFTIEEYREKFEQALEDKGLGEKKLLYALSALLCFLSIFFTNKGLIAFRKTGTIEQVLEPFQYADVGTRAMALFVDFIILCPITVLASTLFLDTFTSVGVVVIIGVLALIPTIYRIYFHHRIGATPGKLICGILVVSPNGSPISLLQSIYREAIELLFLAIAIAGSVFVFSNFSGSFEEMGFLSRMEMVDRSTTNWAAASEWVSTVWMFLEIIVMMANIRRCTIHDLVADTVVVRVPGS